VKRGSRGSRSGGFPTGPELTPKEKAERDRKEAANAREEAEKAREEAKKAGHEAREEEKRAREDRKRHEYKFAREEMREARHNLARERRDDARAARDMARSRRDLGRARTAGLARPGSGGEWVLGGNDEYLTCAAAAVANSLLLATGQRLSDEDVLGLHVAAAGSLDVEASVLGVLEAASGRGLGRVRPAKFQPLAPKLGTAAARSKFACILELALPGGTHAVLLGDGFAVTWGRAVPVTPAFLEHQAVAAWAVTWITSSGGRARC
jgi:hypothetical protein